MSDRRQSIDLEGDPNEERPTSSPHELPVLPLRDTVLFPNSFMPLAVARTASVRLIDDAVGGDQMIAVFTQRDAAVEDPRQEDLHAIGTRCQFIWYRRSMRSSNWRCRRRPD